MTTPEVDDRVPVHADGDGGAHLGAGGEDPGERPSHGLEPGLAESVNDRAAGVALGRRHAGVVSPRISPSSELPA